MRIGIDCRTILSPGIGEQAGVGHYTYYLVKNLLALDKKNQYVLFFDSRFKKTKEFEAENVEIRCFPFYQYKKFLPITYSQMLVSAVLSREKLDVFHAPANIAPLPYKKSYVVTVHDLALYRLPELYPKSFLSRQMFATKILVPQTLTRAARIIAVSKNTKADIIEEFGIPEDKVSVVYEGVAFHQADEFKKIDLPATKKKYGIKNKYLMFLGTIEPRKNIASLVKAFRNLSLVYDSPIKDYQLIIAGAAGWYDKNVYKAIADANESILGKKIKPKKKNKDNKNGKSKKKRQNKNINLERNLPVKYIGYISSKEKLALLKNAACFIFPTLYEGFGLTVLEAMSVGTPVITSNVSSLPELVGDNGAIKINPYKESEISDAIQKIVTDDGLRESLSIKGKEQAKKFDWRQCAEETLEVYKLISQDKK